VDALVWAGHELMLGEAKASFDDTKAAPRRL
jgi:hypothetical protein